MGVGPGTLSPTRSQNTGSAAGRPIRTSTRAHASPARGFAITPRAYLWVAASALLVCTLIVFTGAAVRLRAPASAARTGRKCYGRSRPPLETHAWIEFGNRMLSGLVGVVAAAAGLLAFRRRPFRRDLAVIGVLLPLGVVGQAVLGGFTVRNHLAPGFVMGHYALSMLILIAAAALAWRARWEPGERPRATDRLQRLVGARRCCRSGRSSSSSARRRPPPARTPAAPGTGDEIDRLEWRGADTLDWAIHQHGRIASVLGVAAVGGLVPAAAPRRRPGGAPRDDRRLRAAGRAGHRRRRPVPARAAGRASCGCTSRSRRACGSRCCGRRPRWAALAPVRASPPRRRRCDAEPPLVRAPSGLLVGPAARAREVLARRLLGLALPVALRAEPEQPVEQQHRERRAGGHEEALPARRAAAVGDQEDAAEQEDPQRQHVADRDHQARGRAGAGPARRGAGLVLPRAERLAVAASCSARRRSQRASGSRRVDSWRRTPGATRAIAPRPARALALDLERERALEHEVDLLLALVAVDPPALARLERSG